MSDEIEVSKQWVAKAKNDLLNADNNLKAEEYATENYTGMKPMALVDGK